MQHKITYFYLNYIPFKFRLEYQFETQFVIFVTSVLFENTRNNSFKALNH